MMATMLAHIVVNSGRAAEFEAVAAELWRGTHANEPGVLRYEYWRAAQPDHYYALGCFADHEAFIAHQVSDHHTAAGTAFKGIIASVDVEWVDAVPHANGLPPTNSSPEPLGAGELERHYRQRYPATAQPWWIALRTG
jgi:quinol monooxygenase YgiN